jgi:hypothetical protein
MGSQGMLTGRDVSVCASMGIIRRGFGMHATSQTLTLGQRRRTVYVHTGTAFPSHFQGHARAGRQPAVRGCRGPVPACSGRVAFLDCDASSIHTSCRTNSLPASQPWSGVLAVSMDGWPPVASVRCFALL